MASAAYMSIEACLTRFGPMNLASLSLATDLSEQWVRYLLLLHNDVFTFDYFDTDKLLKYWRVIPLEERDTNDERGGCNDDAI